MPKSSLNRLYTELSSRIEKLEIEASRTKSLLDEILAAKSEAVKRPPVSKMTTKK